MREAGLLLLLAPILAGREEPHTPRDLGPGLLQGGHSKVVFLTPNNTKVVAHQGSSLTLNCRLIRPPNSGLVTWSRRLEGELGLQVLSIGDYTHINDPRFLVVKKPSDDDWLLKVRGVRVADTGEYQCQATTHPPSHILIGVMVVEAFAAITVEAERQQEEGESRYSGTPGPREIFIKQGSRLQLTCELREATERPQFLFWYHDGRVVNHSPDAGKAVTTSRQGWGSTLLIKSANPRDSGNYTCTPQAMLPDTVRVSIMEGEGKQAAVQRDSASRAHRVLGPGALALALALALGPGALALALTLALGPGALALALALALGPGALALALTLALGPGALALNLDLALALALTLAMRPWGPGSGQCSVMDDRPMDLKC